MTGGALSDYEERLVAKVRDFGCCVVSVFDPDEQLPTFSYSVGFWETLGQPEVIILGLDGHMGAFAINETLCQCQQGLVIHDGQRIGGLFKEFDVTCVARAIEPRFLVADYFGSAMWYHEYRTGNALPAAFQLVWGYSGSLPWDADAPPELIEDQPQLYAGRPH